jgi:hypothetical protein
VVVWGQPKRDIQPVKRASATVSAVMSGMSMASGRHVKRSTALRQYVYPADVGRGPTRSMWTCRKRVGGDVKSPSGVIVWRETLERWQAWQVCTQVRQSFCMPGNTKRCATSFAVALVPGCDRSWTDWNTCSRNGDRMYGRGFPADV